MKLALFTALLVALQTPPPVPRQTTKNHADKAGTKPQIPQNGQQSATPSSPPASVSAPTEADTASKSTESHARNTGPSAPKDESWSRADKLSLAYDILTGLLVMVGGFGVGFALKTLRAIEAQTKAVSDSVGVMKDQYIQMRLQTVMLRSSVQHAAKSADAAKTSSDALINSERAWVMLDHIGPHLDHICGLIVQRNFLPKLRVVFRNFGRTPAWIIGHGFRFSLESKDFRPNEKYEGEIDNSFGGPLPPEPLRESWTPIVIEVGMEPEILSGEELQAVVSGDRILVLRGVVVYRDTFSETMNNRLETSICLKLIFRSSDGRIPSRWLYYTPEVNRYT